MTVHVADRATADDAAARAAVRRAALDYLARLSGDAGVFEHADHGEPRRELGYCVDDNARVVVVTGREPDRTDAVDGLYDRGLRMVLAAQAPDGRFHNRCRTVDRWDDAPTIGDHWGRALWALGAAAATRPDHPLTGRAREAFLQSAHQRTSHPRANAYAALGADLLLSADPTAPEQSAAHSLLRSAVGAIGRPRSGTWPWPAPRLTYANARLPEALITAGAAFTDAALLADGVALLEWLVGVETRDGHLSFTPVGGRSGDARASASIRTTGSGPGLDQQPIEAWALSDATARALIATDDPRWQVTVERCAAWFEGRNDTGVSLIDHELGGGCDGLTAAGRNENRGAESTLALIAVLQNAARPARAVRQRGRESTGRSRPTDATVWSTDRVDHTV